MKKLAIVMAAVILVIGAVLFTVWSRQPSKTVIINAPNNNTQTLPPQARLDTAYFNVLLPSGYQVKSQTEHATPQDVLQIVATQPRPSGRQIAVNLAQLPTDGLAAVASYNLRVQSPDVYKTLSFGGMPQGVPTFDSTSDNVYEVTGFWVNGGLYASIAVSGLPGEASLINQDYATVLGAWAWR